MDSRQIRNSIGARAGHWLAGCVLCLITLGAGAQESPLSDVPNLAPPDSSLYQPAPVAAPAGNPAQPPFNSALQQLPDLTRRENFSAAMQILILMTVLSLAPAILIMMTSFTRIIIVLSLLRQALGAQQLPPNQVMIGLALFMTFIVMSPTWNRVNSEALQPYMDGKIDQKQALTLAADPVRSFMLKQDINQNNDADIYLFHDLNNPKAPKKEGDVLQADQIGTMTLIPAFMLSELKTAFYMGFKVYLPFLIVDMVISSVLISMGMMMLPPALISLPFKLLLFVLVDGWRLIAGSLIGSFSP
jgi:flagellar biosynthetic protein FliP